MQSNLTEEQKRSIAAMFLSKGWEMVKTELQLRRVQAARSLVYGRDRNRDEEHRAKVQAIDFLLTMEKDIFAPPPPEESEPIVMLPPIGDRYNEL